MFNIKHDTEVEKGEGFFCEVCLVGKPAGEQSTDPRYCQGCYENLQQEKREMELPKDYWSKDGNFFVHYGEKWGITKNLATVCLGRVTETDSGASEALPARENPVSKLLVNGNPLPPTYETKYQGTGRPKKEGEVSRTTEWRRKKKLQEMLLCT